MERLVRLIKSLKPPETQLIRSFYHSRPSSNLNRRLQLLNLILEKQVDSNEAASQLLYRKKSNSTLSKLKQRLKEDVLNFLLLLPSEKLFNSITNQVENNCRKYIIQAKILMARDLQDESVDLLLKAAELAQKFDLPDIAITVYDQLRAHSAVVKNTDSFCDYNQRIDRSLEIYKHLLQAKEQAQGVFFQSSLPTSGSEKTGQLHASASSSKRVSFWSKIAGIKNHMKQKEYRLALGHAQELLESIKNEPFIFSINHKISLYLDLARANLNLGRFKDAVDHASTAYKLSEFNSLNRFMVLEMNFLSSWYIKDIDRCMEICDEAYRHPCFGDDDTDTLKWNYFKAFGEFEEGKLRDSLKRVNKFRNLRGNKEIFLGGKLLEIYIIIELEDHDWLDFKVDAFRKAAYHWKQGKSRYRLITQILAGLAKTNLNFHEVLLFNSRELKLLKEANPPFSWQPQGFEMLDFHQWFFKKLNRSRGILNKKSIPSPVNFDQKDLS